MVLLGFMPNSNFLFRPTEVKRDENGTVFGYIPASFSKKDKENLINLLDAVGSIQKIHAGLME